MKADVSGLVLLLMAEIEGTIDDIARDSGVPRAVLESSGAVDQFRADLWAGLVDSARSVRESRSMFECESVH